MILLHPVAVYIRAINLKQTRQWIHSLSDESNYDVVISSPDTQQATLLSHGNTGSPEDSGLDTSSVR